MEKTISLVTGLAIITMLFFSFGCIGDNGAQKTTTTTVGGANLPSDVNANNDDMVVNQSDLNNHEVKTDEPAKEEKVSDDDSKDNVLEPFVAINKKCTFTFTGADSSSDMNLIFKDSEHFKSSTTVDGSTTTTIVDGKYAYTYSSGQKMGVKIKVTDSDYADSNPDFGKWMEDITNTGSVEGLRYKCEDYIVNGDDLALPSDIKFVDMNNLKELDLGNFAQ